MLKIAIKLLVALAFSFLLIFIPFCWMTISDIDVASALEFAPVEQSNENLNFEEGSLLRTHDFKYFYEHSSDRRLVEIIEKNFEMDGSDIGVAKDFEISPLLKNTCVKTRCIQYKIPFTQIPLLLSSGLIGIEDYRFLDHFGVDPISILRALVKDIIAGSFVEGGSTLTQQLVKNLFFTNEKTIIRKVKEAILAIYIDLKYEKTDTLRTYFNEVNWGSLQGTRIKGVQAASRIYFGKSVEDLKQYEVAIIVSMLKGPYYYHPLHRTERLKKRANFIFKKLRNIKYFDSKDGNIWTEKQWENWVLRLKDINEGSYLEAIYLNRETPSKDQYFKYKAILASKSILKKFKDVSKELSVKLLVGDSTYIQYYSRFERGLKRPIEEERHQIGSTVKPIIYSLAKNHGVSLADEVDVRPITLNLISGKWTPKESHKLNVESMTINQALQESLNVPVVRIVKEIGFEKFEKDLDVEINDLKKPLSEYPAQLLGAIELSLKEQFELYLRFVKRECAGDLDDENSVIRALSDPLKTTIKRAVNSRLRNSEFFGKTGTTNRGFDNWFMAFDGSRVFAIWTGFEGDRTKVKSLPLYGSSTSFKIFQELVTFSGKRLGALACNLK